MMSEKHNAKIESNVNQQIDFHWHIEIFNTVYIYIFIYDSYEKGINAIQNGIKAIVRWL